MCCPAFQFASPPGGLRVVLPRLSAVFLVLGAWLCGLSWSVAPAAVYQTEALFLQAIEPGSFIETFGALVPDQLVASPLSLAGPAPGDVFGLGLSVEGGFFAIESPSSQAERWLSTADAREPVTITMTGQPVTAFGGSLFVTNFAGDPIPGLLRLTLDSGAVYERPNSSPGDFFGVTTESPIASLTIEYIGESTAEAYITAGSLVVGVAVVPEPATGWIALAGLIGIATLTRGRIGSTGGRLPRRPLAPPPGRGWPLAQGDRPLLVHGD